MDVHGEFYNSYVEGVSRTCIAESLEKGLNDFNQFLSRVDEEKSIFRYAPEKWSIREVIGHIIDTERVFAFRAMSFARGEKQALPGYEENEYGDSSNAHTRVVCDLVDEFRYLRRASISMFSSFSDDQLNQIGIMSGTKASVRSIGRIMVGHPRHHLKVLEDRYF